MKESKGRGSVRKRGKSGRRDEGVQRSVMENRIEIEIIDATNIIAVSTQRFGIENRECGMSISLDYGNQKITIEMAIFTASLSAITQCIRNPAFARAGLKTLPRGTSYVYSSC